MFWWKIWRFRTQLRAKDRDVRRRAVEALAQSGDARVVEPLVAALRDEDYNVRAAAAQALGRSGDARAVKPLVASLRDQEWWVSNRAAEALRKIAGRDPRAVEPLVVALRDRHWDTRVAAAQALGAIGWQSSVVSERALCAILTGRWTEVVCEGPAAVASLLDVLQCGDLNTRKKAAEVLVKIGSSKAVAPLLTDFDDDEEGIKVDAAVLALQSLAKIGDPGTVDLLLTALRHKNEAVRRSAAAGLGQIGGAQAVQPLMGALKDDNGGVVKATARALGQIGDPRAVNVLAAALRDRRDYVSFAAAEALSNLGSAAVKPLVAALKDKDSLVRCAAADALKKLGWQSSDGGERAWYAVANRNFAEAILEGSAAIEPLVVAFQGGFGWRLGNVQLSAVQALRRIGWQPSDAGQRAWYAVAARDWAKAMREGAAAVEPLVAAFEVGDRDTRLALAQALGEIGDARATEPLLAALRDRHGGALWPRAAADKVWRGTLGGVSVNAFHITGDLFDVLHYKQDDVQEEMDEEDLRALATEALGKIACPQAVGSIISKLKGGNWRISSGSLILILQKTLERNSKSIQDNDLRAIATLNDTVAKLNFYWWAAEERQPVRCGDTSLVDCTIVKELARQELTHRGLKADDPPSQRCANSSAIFSKPTA